MYNNGKGTPSLLFAPIQIKRKHKKKIKKDLTTT